MLAVAGAVAALAVIIGGVAVATGLWPLGPNAPLRVAFSPVVPTGITALADVTPVTNGTDVKMECVYAEESEPKPGGGYANYSIFVVDRSGQGEQIKSWSAKPNKQMRPGGHTTWRLTRIDRLELRDTNTNEVLLQASIR